MCIDAAYDKIVTINNFFSSSLNLVNIKLHLETAVELG